MILSAQKTSRARDFFIRAHSTGQCACEKMEWEGAVQSLIKNIFKMSFPLTSLQHMILSAQKTSHARDFFIMGGGGSSFL